MSENKVIYHGPFSEHLKAFISEKRLLGCAYIEEERLSVEFDLLSMKFDCSMGLTEELAHAFIKCKPNWQATTQKRHISFLHNFATYLLRHDIKSIHPQSLAFKLPASSFKPYIFSHDQISDIFDLADNIHPSCRNSNIFYPVLFRTLYGTGMRISEALSLTMNDVDFSKNTITVINPKNHKDRCLPIDDSLTEYLEWYRMKVHPTYHNDDLFFMSNCAGGHYSRNNVQVYFSNLIAKLNIPTNGYKGGGPHLHCLRHTFCVHSLAQLISNDVPHDVALQLLSAYMGHQSLSATGRYLQLTAEAFPDLIDAMEKIYHDIFPCLEQSGEEHTSYEES